MQKLLSLLAIVTLTGNVLYATNTTTTPNPFEEIQKIQQQIDEIFTRLHQKFLNDTTFSEFSNTFIKTPTTDILDKDDYYLVKADIPGVDDKSIKVIHQDGKLTIQAKTIKEKQEKSDTYLHQERFVGVFVKTITLPKDANASKLKTDYQNGVLIITIPKHK